MSTTPSPPAPLSPRLLPRPMHVWRAGGRQAGAAGVSAAKPWRQLLVWLHILSSVSWMSQSLAVAMLVATSATSPAGEVKAATASVALLIDSTLLTPSLNASAATGVLLAATSTWGFFHHWWVAAKLAATYGLVYIGLLLVSGALPGVVAAAAAGQDGAAGRVAAGAGALAAALALITWLSVAKPLGRTPLAVRAPRPVAAPTWLLASAVFAVVIDTVTSTVREDRLPVLSTAVIVVTLVLRTRQHRAATALHRYTPATTAGRAKWRSSE